MNTEFITADQLDAALGMAEELIPGTTPYRAVLVLSEGALQALTKLAVDATPDQKEKLDAASNDLFHKGYSQWASKIHSLYPELTNWVELIDHHRLPSVPEVVVDSSGVQQLRLMTDQIELALNQISGS